MMYFGDYELFDICEVLNIEMATLRFYIFGEDESGSNEACWYKIKKQLSPLAVSIYLKDKISVLDKTAGIALNILTENLTRIQSQFLSDTNFSLNLDDTKKLASIVVDMDKIVRLESGKPTEIVDAIASMSLSDARRILLEDPFQVDVIEADYGEILGPGDDIEVINHHPPSIERSDGKKVVAPWE